GRVEGRRADRRTSVVEDGAARRPGRGGTVAVGGGRPGRGRRDRPGARGHRSADRGLRPASRRERQLRGGRRTSRRRRAHRRLRGAGRHQGRREQPRQTPARRAEGVVPRHRAGGAADRHGVRRDHACRPPRRVADLRRRVPDRGRRGDPGQRRASVEAADERHGARAPARCRGRARAGRL
ncbi:MAG: YbaK/prolyl-tRNA synthetase associated region, partial [uncultured Nocardioidaceae bacterium]